MQLRMSVAGPETAVVDLLVSAPAGTSFAAVRCDVRAALGHGSGSGALSVDGHVLRDVDVLGCPPLVNGCTVTAAGRSPSPGPRTVLRLRVVGGPDAGQTYPLAPGSARIGRAADAEVRVADPDVSRAHAELQVTWDGVTVRDLRSTNGTRVDGVAVGTEPVAIAAGTVLRAGSTACVLDASVPAPAAVTATGDGTLAVNRAPRLRPARPPAEVALPAPPRERERPRLPVVALVLPLAAGVALAILLHNPSYLLFTVLSPVLLLGQWWSDRGSRTRDDARERAEYDARLAAATARLGSELEAERRARRARAPDPAHVLTAALGPTPQLWERRVGDDDALLLRLGLGDVPADLRVAEPGRDASLGPREPELLADVPVTVHLGEVGALGICGPRERVLAAARCLLGQLAVLHSPRDLGVVVLSPGTAAPDWAWARWLPHVQRSRGRPDAVGFDDAQVSDRVGELLDELRARSALVAGRPERWEGPRIVVLLDGSRALRTLPGVAQVLVSGPAVGIHAMCLADDAGSLPVECRAVARLTGPAGTCLDLDLDGRLPVRQARADGVGTGWAERLARALTRLRDATPDDGHTSLPESARLVDVLAGRSGAAAPGADEVRAAWSGPRRRPVACLGVAGRARFEVDLRRDGPHVLVAGTTGSGKSELLQTLVASLALGSRPDELGFLLVDYKGGAAFAACAELPHTVGLVTDLDGHLTERALASLNAELRRRERLLRGAGAADLDTLSSRVEPGASPAPPRLVIVVDEFATLVEELPDFVRGLVGVAQRGRSLGVHLVLATQRPSGVVSADIRANTNLRIALRVTDEAESVDVLDARDAAAIPRGLPGRAVARCGTEPLVTFQAARVIGSGRGDPGGAERPTVARVCWREAGAAPAPATGDPTRSAVSDLDGIVAATRGAALDLDIRPGRRPWLPALPSLVRLADLPLPVVDEPHRRPEATGGVTVLPYALADLPSQQEQRVVALDLSGSGHLMAVGGPRSGRTSLLRTLAVQVGRLTAPEDVHLYAVDCGGGSLAGLADLPHTGAVVPADDTDRVDRLLRRLTAECARRQTLLSIEGHADLAEQRAVAAAADRLPYVLLLLDRWEGFLGALDDLDGGRLTDLVLRLLRDGPAVGLRVVLTADRSGLMGRAASLVQDKLLLQLPDRSDYGLAGVPTRTLPLAMPPGRAVRAGDGVELQLALSGQDSSGSGQGRALREVAAAASALAAATARRASSSAVDRGRLAFRVDALPVRVPWSRAVEAGRRPSSPLAVLAGLGGDDLAAQWVDLAREGPGFVVAGPARTGRSSTLLALGTALLDGGCQVVVVAPRPGPVRSLGTRPGCVGVLDGGAADGTVVDRVVSRPGPLVVLVDDAELLTESPSGASLEVFLRSARDRDRALVAAGTTGELLHGFRGLVVEARKSRAGLLLSPEQPLDGELFGLRLPRSVVARGPVGRAALVVGGAVLAVQVPYLDDPAATGR